MNRFTQGVGLAAKVVLVGSSVALLGAACWKGVGTNTNVGSGNVVANENTNTVVGNTNAEVIANVGANTNGNTDSTGEIDTSDWLTYTNEEYGFSVKYPDDWKIAFTVQEKCWSWSSPESLEKNEIWIEEQNSLSEDLKALYRESPKFKDFSLCFLRKKESENSLEEWYTEHYVGKQANNIQIETEIKKTTFNTMDSLLVTQKRQSGTSESVVFQLNNQNIFALAIYDYAIPLTNEIIKTISSN